MKKTIFFMLAMVMAVCASFAQAQEITVSGANARVDVSSAFLRHEGAVNVKLDYTSEEVMGKFKGKPWPGINVSTDSNIGSGIFIPISDNAVKNGLCADQKRLLRSIIVRRQPIVSAVDVCGDIPWDATGIWADFPEGAIGSESQLRPNTPCEDLSGNRTCKAGETVIAYKYKLVTRKDDKIHATKCFKKQRIWSLAELSAKWGVKLSVLKTFGNVGDGGKLSTLVIGIVK